jgi:hypothetical protein
MVTKIPCYAGAYYYYYYCCCCKGGRPYLYRTAAANGPIIQPQMNTWVNMEQWWNDTDRENQRNKKKACSSATLSTTISHGLPWAWTQASMVRSW